MMPLAPAAVKGELHLQRNPDSNKADSFPKRKGAAILVPIVVAASVAAYQENEQFREFVDQTVRRASQLWENFKSGFDAEGMMRRQERKMHSWGMSPQEGSQRVSTSSTTTTTTRDGLRRGAKTEKAPADADGDSKDGGSEVAVVRTDVEASEGNQDGLRRRKGPADGMDDVSAVPSTPANLPQMNHGNALDDKLASQPSGFREVEERDPSGSVAAATNQLSGEYEDVSSSPKEEDTTSMYNSVFDDDPLHYNPFADPALSSPPPTLSRQNSLPHPLRSNPIDSPSLVSPALSRITSSAATVEAHSDDDDDEVRSIATLSEAFTDADSDEALQADDEEEEYAVYTPTSEDADDAMSEASFVSGWSEV